MRTIRGGYWFPEAETCCCAAHFAYRATVGSKMKCKMNGRYVKNLKCSTEDVEGGGGPCDGHLSKSYYNSRHKEGSSAC